MSRQIAGTRGGCRSARGAGPSPPPSGPRRGPTCAFSEFAMQRGQAKRTWPKGEHCFTEQRTTENVSSTEMATEKGARPSRSDFFPFSSFSS